ncbi:MAG: metallophosphoesterase [Planctomycetota bacterium]
MTRLVALADLHLNHRKSRESAEAQARQVVRRGSDVLFMLGDAAVWDGDTLDECLGLFDDFRGAKLFVPGNHDLWTSEPSNDALNLLTDALPRRVAATGWHWLQGSPFRVGDLAIVGNLGWYDLGFSVDSLNIPKPFYEAGVSPGYVLTRGSPKQMIDDARRCEFPGNKLFARWNDTRYVRGARADIFDQCMADLDADLLAVADAKTVVAATHTVPLAGLLPPRRMLQLDFVRAYLGSPKLGGRMLAAPNVRHILCGHSHFPAECDIGPVNAINIGSGYRKKLSVELSLPS